MRDGNKSFLISFLCLRGGERGGSFSSTDRPVIGTIDIGNNRYRQESVSTRIVKMLKISIGIGIGILFFSVLKIGIAIGKVKIC